MRRVASAFIDMLVFEEVRRMVAEAIRTALACRPRCVPPRLFEKYPRCGLDVADLANEVMTAAARARVPIERGAGIGAAVG